jgi:hypothetical protein
LGLVGEGDGVNEKIERAPGARDRGEHGVDRGNVLDIARQHQVGVHRRGERLDALGQGLALKREGELGAVLGEHLGNAPGNGMIVGDPHDQATLAVHQALHAGIPLS